MTQCPRLTIAGIGGDSGKTVVSVGLSRVWWQKGYKVIPFKKGPDYIDMSWLSLGANHPCYNLDLFFMTNEQVLFSYSLNTQQADIAIIEGNRGLYDGMDVQGSVSTAEVAKLLYSPVILIVDCTKVTRTVAALVLGCQTFDPNVSIQGVILNQLATHRHETIIRKSIEHYCNLPVVGAIPRLSNITFPGRHLGLVPPQEHPRAQEAIDKAAETIEKFLDVDKLWQIAHQAPPLEVTPPPIPPPRGGRARERVLRIAVIKDSAFQFYYPENIEALKRAGAEIVEFSALTDDLPLSIHALYIGGGFPETHAAALSANESLRQSIRKAVEDGLPIYAECGGLMYLGEKLVWEGKDYPMVGVLPIVIGVSKKPQGHGYSIIEVEAPNPFFRPGQILRGHEFHYSHLIDIAKKDNIYFAFNMKKGQGIKNNRDGLCYKNVLATYTHLHALGTKEWIEGIMNRAVMYKEQRQFQETP
ncbi:MAG: cobyrinic acid a,c-diamide synthase [Nitrospirae bacterium RBG_13_43_8]|nr:MAG: cobyrinic acid a,c-diamide synthase [Nitrospirae bacterium RBG_13_43_8]